MVSQDGRYGIVLNGEIYNYRALRSHLESDGCRFRSTSDTEVLLHLYARHGYEMVHALRGMFAFAIWDDVKKGLFLARDHFGIKPLYFHDDGKTFRCASQVKALVAGGGFKEKIEPAGHVGFFLWGSVPEPYTLYQDIFALPAGHTLSEPEILFSKIEDDVIDAEIARLNKKPADMVQQQASTGSDMITFDEYC